MCRSLNLTYDYNNIFGLRLKKTNNIGNNTALNLLKGYDQFL